MVLFHMTCEMQKAIFAMLTRSKIETPCRGCGVVHSHRNILFLYVSQAASVQKVVVHDGYAISRPSQDSCFT